VRRATGFEVRAARCGSFDLGFRIMRQRPRGVAHGAWGMTHRGWGMAAHGAEGIGVKLRCCEIKAQRWNVKGRRCKVYGFRFWAFGIRRTAHGKAHSAQGGSTPKRLLETRKDVIALCFSPSALRSLPSKSAIEIFRPGRVGHLLYKLRPYTMGGE
jgi:hypothetical protein